MIELGQSQSANGGAHIVDVTEDNFMAEVVEMSNTVPVIVDFWAPWCGPCKTLGPALESAVAKAGGKVRMAKIDVDKNQMLAGQMRVQSVPTVFAFWQGQPIDGFQGALPQSEIDTFMNKLLELGDDGGLDAAVEAAEEMYEAGDIDDAAQTFAAIVEEDPKNAAAFAGLAKCHVAQGAIDEAEAVLNGVPADISSNSAIEAVFAQIALARQAENAGPVADLTAAVEADPSNMQARLDLATALHADGQVGAAVDALLAAFQQDREWNNGAAKEQLFQVFDSLKPNDPIVLDGRRKLSSMIFV
ncbi:putative thioredoxin [Pacificibacter maritimus]|uniref:Putative thioredoxin n=1 Tax=Pacificibacter maritimus TaxID=762213 RepID=A0A3N4UCE8_9RHOB|nr:co-chaperone YbbN [Pacificibacter maritimus]RPE64851.1 putative thioredoxin [Pacificibacter maritimus]